MIDLKSFDDLPIVRRVRDSLRRWWGLEIGLALSDGYVASHATGRVVPPDNPFCRASLALAEGFGRCNRSVEEAVAAIAVAPSVAPRALRVQTCHLGFPMVFVPLVRQGTFLGALFVGGFAVEGEDDDRLAKVVREARHLRLDPHTTDQSSLARVPRLTRRDYVVLCDLVELLADELLQWPGVVESLEQQVGAGGGRDERMQFEAIVGKSPVMQQLYTMIERVAPSESTVLITGEDGTGKELVAHAIHARSRRSERPFVIRNCSAFNDNLLESELFGHVRGSFTGADRDRRGVFEQAHTGTLFLDEVGDTSPAMQVKLLRVLQDKTFVPVGGASPIQVDVRVVAATNRRLMEMVRKGTFRKDLYYRLNVINLHLPPLRERSEDLPHLCDAFLDAFARRSGAMRKSLAPTVLERLYAHDWPGNIRELQSEIERLVVLSGDGLVIRDEFLSPEIQLAESTTRRRVAHGNKPLAELVAELEREVISRHLVRHHWNKKRVAAELGISRTTLLRKIADYGLEGPEVVLR